MSLFRRDWRKGALSELARYGFGLTHDNRVVLKNGNTSTVVVSHAKGRFHAHSTSGNPLWSGPRIAAFLEAFWLAKPVT